MKMTEQGRKLLMEREGCRLKAYKDSVGVWTIGVRPYVRRRAAARQGRA